MTRIEKRRRALLASKQDLPAGYTRREFIGYNARRAYLVTNIPISGATVVKADIWKFGASTTGTIFPSAHNPSTGITNTNWGTLENLSGSRWSAYPVHNKNANFVKTTIISTKTTATGSDLIGLGYSSDSYVAFLRFYNLQILNQQNVVFDGVPCSRDSDNTPGMYDRISQTFYPCTGAWFYG